MTLTLQPARVATGEGGEALLVFNDGWLVALLVRLSDLHDGIVGQWFLEIGFGRLAGHQHAVFEDLDAAHAWILDRLTRRDAA